MVAGARTLLSTEFTEQLQEIYGIQPDGTIIDLDKLTHLDDEQQAIAAMLRDRVKHLASTMSGEKKPLVAAIDRMIREQAFTLLNRFAALRMCEERQLIKESIGSGIQSKGFKVYLQIAGSGLGDTYARYKTYLLCLFDEIAIDLGVMFDRYSSLGLLFPREDSLLALLELLDDNDIQPLWAEDETIGWIYQYFNSQEERRQMRDASAAPRNSRELAVRNQFFTPRYVVEFLTDNTLGRIWYEMTQGETALKEECRYLVRRPNEIFLSEGETAPEEEQASEDLSQEELLRQPVYIPFRKLKDPRQIRMLDPACGSMHFGLYAFDLYERIYEEAWQIEEQYGAMHFERDQGLAPLHECYETREEFVLDIPRLIIEHNIHGIDIDPRAVQIAGLSLWLRAQRTWQQQGVKQDGRPAITRSNIVCAEPMPGNKAMLAEFSANLQPRVLGQLLEIIFDKMQLAGEAGSLLKIEEEIADAVEQARQEFNKELQARKDSAGYLPGMAPEKRQTSLFDFADLPDETELWERAEEMIIQALEEYAGQAQNGDTNKRRLFAKDAARGFAFIDLCRKRYDVVLMNPPFGQPTPEVFKKLRLKYKGAHNDIFCSFVRRATGVLDRGKVGAITSRSFLLAPRLEYFRRKDIIPYLEHLVDFGLGVMDDAYVESAAYILTDVIMDEFDFIDLRNSNFEYEKELEIQIQNYSQQLSRNSWFNNLPNAKILYSAPASVRNILGSHAVTFEPTAGTAREGMKSFNNERFIRLWWEIPPSLIGRKNCWVYLAKGGGFSFFYSDIHLLLNWFNNGAELQAVNQDINNSTAQVRQASDYWYQPGVTYSKRSAKGFSARVLPADCIFTSNGPAILPVQNISPLFILGWVNSKPIRAIIHMQANFADYSTGAIKKIPWHINIHDDHRKHLENLILKIVEKIRYININIETSTYFMCVDLKKSCSINANIENLIQEVMEQWDSAVAKSYGFEDLRWAEELFEINVVELYSSIGKNGEEISIIDRSLTISSLFYFIGCIFGRWDIRIAISPVLVPKLPDPFDPLPACPPGMLVSTDGLPAESGNIVSEEWLRARPDANTLPPKSTVSKATISDAEYPLRITWNGILVDDSGNDGTQPHREDIIRRIHEVFDLLWKEKAPEIEQEACEILGVRELRQYFQKPTKFFQNHLKRYSKSRRKAPIYWPLSTKSGSYTLWLYYHRLTDQTLFTCVTEFLDPKIKDVSADIAALKEELQQESTSTTDNRRKLEKLQDMESELKDFREELLRIANLPYKPNLNDGVMITAAPLWKLFRHRQWSKDLKKCWDKLEKGDYDWAHLACSIWPERVIPKCHKDRSLAIAHDLEEEFWQEIENGTDRQGNPKYKWVPKKLSKEDIRAIIREKTGK